MEAKYLDVEAAMTVWNKIEEIDLDSLTPVSHERLFLSEFAKALRPALRKLGLTNRMVGVQVPNYSMASTISVVVPNVMPKYDYRTIKALSPEAQESYFAEMRELDAHRRDACRKMNQIVLRLFPECDNRSDPMIDWFDARFSCY